MIGKKIFVNNEEFNVDKFLGKGKAGYSYLISSKEKRYVYKQIHHEPCEYYKFGNKILAEIHAYERLKNTGIGLPELLEYNEEKEYLIKTFIDGKTAAEMAAKGELTEKEYQLAFEMAGKLYAHKINVDFFPTNFVFENGEIFCVDYECNQYMEEWDFESWGIYFWLNSKGMEEHLDKGKSENLCLPNSGKPVTEPFEEAAKNLIERFSKKDRSLM